MRKSFELKHEKLIKEENELKEKLKNEVTKVKEKLENFLSESNTVIKTNEKINKGIKIFEKEKEKNMLKTLSYMSTMNKKKKDINKLFQQLMKNLKISFHENDSTIKYEDYYFNGLQIPKDIEFNNIESHNIKISWKIDNINITNIDNSQIKFRLQIRKANENENFSQIYEGNNTNYLITNLNINTSYEIRICCVYKNLIGSWCKIHNVKTSSPASIILEESKREKEFLQKIYEWCGYSSMKLIYRGSRDGTTSIKFHEKCDNQGPTICLYQTKNEYIFGGYASISWTREGGYKTTNDSFLFTLTNIHGLNPTKFVLKESQIKYSVEHNSNYGPKFGEDIKICDDFRNKDSISGFPCDYSDSLGKGKSIFTGNFDNNNKNFKIKEIEVFKLFK